MSHLVLGHNIISHNILCELELSMSLVQGYSSEEDNGSSSPTNDTFGLSRLPTTKKIRVEEPQSLLQPQAAPHVLAEVAHPY